MNAFFFIATLVKVTYKSCMYITVTKLLFLYFFIFQLAIRENRVVLTSGKVYQMVIFT